VPVVKLCAEPRCGRPRLTNHWTARCELHAKAYSRAKDARRSSANPTYRRLLGSTEYEAAKELVRRRDRTCRMADGTCRGRLEVHHHTPIEKGGAVIEKGGAVADLDNLVLLCVRHHRMAEHQAKKARGAMSSRRATNQSRTVFPRTNRSLLSLNGG
jgi:5-methylcytosine-specific restriction endonuclease McrA